MPARLRAWHSFLPVAGNISVDRAGSRVTASSAGGQIIFGEARGAIQAHTAGGGIRVIRVAGPMQLDSNGGSILLTQVEKEVHASTGAGSITAWFSPGGKLAAPSQLGIGTWRYRRLLAERSGDDH